MIDNDDRRRKLVAKKFPMFLAGARETTPEAGVLPNHGGNEESGDTEG
jgi:hypothetical protein